MEGSSRKGCPSMLLVLRVGLLKNVFEGLTQTGVSVALRPSPTSSGVFKKRAFCYC